MWFQKAILFSVMAAALSASTGCKTTSQPAAPSGTNEVKQYSSVDPTTYVYNDQTYAIVERAVADKTFEVEVSGLAQVMKSTPQHAQLAANIGAQYLAHNGKCGGFNVPGFIQSSQTYNAKHEYWKQAYRCP